MEPSTAPTEIGFSVPIHFQPGLHTAEQEPVQFGPRGVKAPRRCQGDQTSAASPAMTMLPLRTMVRRRRSLRRRSVVLTRAPARAGARNASEITGGDFVCADLLSRITHISWERHFETSAGRSAPLRDPGDLMTADDELDMASGAQ